MRRETSLEGEEVTIFITFFYTVSAHREIMVEHRLNPIMDVAYWTDQLNLPAGINFADQCGCCCLLSYLNRVLDVGLAADRALSCVFWIGRYLFDKHRIAAFDRKPCGLKTYSDDLQTEHRTVNSWARDEAEAATFAVKSLRGLPERRGSSINRYSM